MELCKVAYQRVRHFGVVGLKRFYRLFIEIHGSQTPQPGPLETKRKPAAAGKKV